MITYKLYIIIRNVAKNMNPLWKDVQIVRYIWVWSSLSVSVSVSVCCVLCVVVVVVVVVAVVVLGGEEEGGEKERRRGGEGMRLMEPSGPKFPSRLLELNSLIK